MELEPAKQNDSEHKSSVVKTCQKRKNWMNEFSSPIYFVGPMFS